MQIFLVLFAIAAILMIYSLIETRWLTVTHYDISSSRIPDDLTGKRIVMLSDLHNTNIGRNNERLIRRIKECTPDYIVIAGDVINGNTSKKQFRYARELFRQLKELNVPVYYSFGNHECRLKGFTDISADYKNYLHLSRKNTILLNNGSVFTENNRKNRTEIEKNRTNSNINRTDIGKNETNNTRIYGLMLPPEQFKRKTGIKLIKPVSKYIGKADSSCYNILIAHDPYYFEEYMKWGADLVLSGHIHGGIIRLPFIGGLISPRFEFFPKIDKGLYKYSDGRVMIVSGGIGWHGLPFRFMNRPEIITIDFKSVTDETSNI